MFNTNHNNIINTEENYQEYINIDSSSTENKKYSMEEFSQMFGIFQQMINIPKDDNQTNKKNKKNIEEDEELPKLKEGSIRKRGTNSYEARFYENGIRKSVFAKTALKCKEKLERAIRERDQFNRNAGLQGNHTLDQWFEKWIATYKKPYVKEQTIYTITSKYDKYIKNKLGKRNIKSISAIEWQELFNNIQHPVSARRLKGYMKSCYEKAIINKIVIDNAIKGVELTKKHITREKFIPTHKQLYQFLDHLKDKRNELRLTCEFLALTGVRIGEACALTHKDVDKVKKTIHIDKSYSRYSKKTEGPKTPKSVRTIPINDRVLEIIDEYTKTYGKKDRIFYKIKSENITNSVKYHARTIGLNDLSPHSFRHYFISLCNEANIDPKVITEWTGHADYELTFKTYTHVTEDFSKHESEKLTAYINQEK